MPGLDGTGPMGMGPMTGGARGWCNPYGPMYGAPRFGMWGGGPMSYRAPYGYGTPYSYGALYGYGMPYGYGGWGMYPRFGRGMGPCGGRMAWGRGRGMGRGRWC